MKNKIILTTVSAFFILHSAFAQGSLTPPGAPAPTMKTLDQIEARTPISAVPFTITQPGSYYLTTNLVWSSNVSGIDVGNISEVTIDLNGFSLRNTNVVSILKRAISINGVAGQQVTVRNGFITGATNGISGIGINDGNLGSVLVEDVHCYTVYSGISLNNGQARNIVRHCSVENAGYRGIVADVVTGCTVRNTFSDGISASTVTDCQVIQTSGIGSGITYDGNVGIVVNSIGVSIGGTGINGTAVANSHGRSTSGTGIFAYNANNCTGYRTSGTAISATVANGCYAFSGTNIITFKYNMP